MKTISHYLKVSVNIIMLPIVAPVVFLRCWKDGYMRSAEDFWEFMKAGEDYLNGKI